MVCHCRCRNNKVRIVLEEPTTYSAFVSYKVPECSGFSELIKHDLCEIVFPSVSRLSVITSIRTDSSNTFIYNILGIPILANSLIADTIYNIDFIPHIGGYVLTNPICSDDLINPVPIIKENANDSKTKIEDKKEVIKK